MEEASTWAIIFLSHFKKLALKLKLACVVHIFKTFTDRWFC